ncbi:organoarsenical effux MFS transporter ArsJ [uncultured Pseudoteredinibacter sp.]|uniref:organoarsenical effux MFS transporter ArsJ n=1 Tax=uncultured Pseudoteredinibacter sp. TaxID=1641701 RepID=UPI0026185108|nr:organoarsenical effux MFS transporter ArsJ [uncultured Pseudoteredinibacter sp.]
MNSGIRQYALICANYWAFTITDGALRMLVLWYFHQQGFGALAIASLFVLYELCGVFTNLFGGWLGARIGLNQTMNVGLLLQICALGLLLVPADMLSVAWVMMAQAGSGIAKDLNKMSAKSAIKNLVPQDQLFRWVARLTGSKNSLKGLGFFVGAALYQFLGFQQALLLLMGLLFIALVASLLLLDKQLGRSKYRAKFTELFSNSAALNQLSGARLFLFAARDVWFVVALPVSLAQYFGWEHSAVGGFLAVWIIIYGAVQGFVPQLLKQQDAASRLCFWAVLLAILTFAIALPLLFLAADNIALSQLLLLLGLLAFAGIFAINSAYHSYLVVAYARADGASLDVGFYYMSNALGRLLGTILSGWIFASFGLAACLLASAAMLLAAGLLARGLPNCE